MSARVASHTYRPAGTLVRAAACTLVAVGIGSALRRPDLVVLAAPMVFWSLLAGRRGDRAPSVAAVVSVTTTLEGETIELGIGLRGHGEADVVVLAVDAYGLELPVGARSLAVALDADEARDLVVTLTAPRWGVHRAGPVRAVAWAPGASGVADVTVGATTVRALPRTEAFAATGAVARTAAYAGTHRTSATGPGAELAVVRPFHAGDRLRRIHWPATLRSGVVHVTATTTERFARVAILLEATEDAGPVGDSILDVSVRAAGAIAQHFLDAGDVVTLTEIGQIRRRLGPLIGRNDVERVRSWLVDVASAGGGARYAPWLDDVAVSGRLVICLSPLLSEATFEQIASIAARGAAVVVVDTLASGAAPVVHDDLEQVAIDLWRVARDEMVGRLLDLGVATVAWAGPGSLDEVFADLARMSAAPRRA